MIPVIWLLQLLQPDVVCGIEHRAASQPAIGSAERNLQSVDSLARDLVAPWHPLWTNSVAVCATMKEENITDVKEWLAYYKYVFSCSRVLIFNCITEVGPSSNLNLIFRALWSFLIVFVCNCGGNGESLSSCDRLLTSREGVTHAVFLESNEDRICG
jgi:hypothetical protein